MQFADATELEFRDPGTRHREGDIRFKYLLRGQAGSPQNYELSIVHTEGRFYSPPHRHNFDQFRWVLSGSFGDPDGLQLRTGELGYYPEGTPYKIESGTSDVLLLQFGGASGAGFTHYDELRANYPVLAQRGEFHDGIFRWHTPPPGAAKQQDGYEALWELINGKPLTYPKQRYRQPVLMAPGGFDWTPVSAGLSERVLGRFTERDIGALQWRVDAGASATLQAGPTIRLVTVLSGDGRLGEHALRPGCAFELLAGQRVALSAAAELTMLALDLPRFDGARSAREAARDEARA